MLPTLEEIKRLAKNVEYAKACNNTACKNCDWKNQSEDCRLLAREFIKKEKNK